MSACGESQTKKYGLSHGYYCPTNRKEGVTEAKLPILICPSCGQKVSDCKTKLVPILH